MRRYGSAANAMTPACFANQALDAEGWKQTVDEMARMADGTNDDFAAITSYLTKAFPAN